ARCEASYCIHGARAIVEQINWGLLPTGRALGISLAECLVVIGSGHFCPSRIRSSCMQTELKGVPAEAPGSSRSPASRDYDVVVVGAGGAGLSAAAMAAREGARVLLLEAGERVGGSTALSGGVFYA